MQQRSSPEGMKMAEGRGPPYPARQNLVGGRRHHPCFTDEETEARGFRLPGRGPPGVLRSARPASSPADAGSPAGLRACPSSAPPRGRAVGSHCPAVPTLRGGGGSVPAPPPSRRH